MKTWLSAYAAALLLAPSLRAANAENQQPAFSAPTSAQDTNFANGLHEVVVTGRGINDEEALKAAFVFALERTVGTIIHSETVSPAKLAMIERAENILRDLHFHDVRVRHHILSGSDNALARIEIGSSEIPRLLINDLWATASREIQKIGYAHVTLDLQGYLPRALPLSEAPSK